MLHRRYRSGSRLILVVFGLAISTAIAAYGRGGKKLLSDTAQPCVECHKKITPNIVSDWQQSKHSQNDIDCATCHGDKHIRMDDADKAEIPTPQTCATCHETSSSSSAKANTLLAGQR